MEANSAKLVTEAQKANKALKGVQDSATGMQKSLSLISAASIVSLAKEAIQAGRQIYNFTKSIAEAGDQIVDMAEMTGMSITEFQRWNYVMRMNDVDTATFTMGVKLLVGNMQEAQEGTGDSAAAFKGLGISVTDTYGRLKSFEKIFPELIAEFGQMEDGTNKIAYAVALFGKSGMQMIEVLSLEKEKLEKLKKEAELYGMTQEDIVLRNADAKESFTRFGIAMDQFKLKLVPVVELMAKLLDLITGVSVVQMYEYPEVDLLTGEPVAKFRRDLDEMERRAKSIESKAYTGDWAGKKKQYPQLDKIDPQHKALEELAKAYGITVDKLLEIRQKLYGGIKDNEHFIENLRTEGWEGAAASAEGILEKWIKDDIEKAKEEEKKYWTDRMAEGNRYTKMILDAQEAEILYGITEDKGTVDEMIKKAKEGTEALDALGKEFASTLTSNMTTLMSTTDNWGEKFKKVGESILQTIMQIIIKQMLMNALFEDSKNQTGFLDKGSGLGTVVSGIGKLLGLAEGGIFPGHFMPIRQFASGGVADRPTLGLIGEGGGPEAVVPLKGGSIPVDMKGGGGGGNTIVIMNIEATDVDSFERKYGGSVNKIFRSSARKGGQARKSMRSYI